MGGLGCGRVGGLGLEPSGGLLRQTDFHKNCDAQSQRVQLVIAFLFINSLICEASPFTANEQKNPRGSISRRGPSCGRRTAGSGWRRTATARDEEGRRIPSPTRSEASLSLSSRPRHLQILIPSSYADGRRGPTTATDARRRGK